MNFRLPRDQVVLLETAANLWASWRKANDFLQVFLVLSWEYNKTLVATGPATAEGNIEDLGETNSLFLLGPVIKCLLNQFRTKIRFDTREEGNL